MFPPHDCKYFFFPLPAVGHLLSVYDFRFDRIPRRAFQYARFGVIGYDKHDFPVRDHARLLRVYDRLKVGTAARTEDGDSHFFA